MATRKYVSIQKLGLYDDKIKNYTDTAVNSLSTQVAYIDTEDNENIEDVGGASNITVDSALSTTSTNPVQNKVVTNKFNQLQQEKADKSYVVSVFEQLKQLIQNGDIESAVAVLDEAILDLSTLA